MEKIKLVTLHCVNHKSSTFVRIKNFVLARQFGEVDMFCNKTFATKNEEGHNSATYLNFRVKKSSTHS
jgi:hypothetical protein